MTVNRDDIWRLPYPDAAFEPHHEWILPGGDMSAGAERPTVMPGSGWEIPPPPGADASGDRVVVVYVENDPDASVQLTPTEPEDTPSL
jgi:hypothetical protein